MQTDNSGICNCWDDFLTPHIEEMPDRFELEYKCAIAKKYLRVYYSKNEEPYTPEDGAKIAKAIFPVCLACTQRNYRSDNEGNKH